MLDCCNQAVQFLLARQAPNGAWHDFITKPGRSDAWVTAYVGFALQQWRTKSGDTGVQLALDRATQFIVSARQESGWAYNGRCAPDADSTAHAILFLEGSACPPRHRDYAALAKFQLSCGAFTTYRIVEPDHSWGKPHPDVTAVSLRVMGRFLGSTHGRVQQASASLQRYLHSENQGQSFWWRSHHYLPAQLLHLPQLRKEALGLLKNLAPPDQTCFDRALAFECTVLACEPNEALARTLKEAQNSDGSWPSHPILRVRDPRPDTTNQDLDGIVVADDRRLFTTATVLRALSRGL